MKHSTWIFILVGLAIVIASPQLMAQIEPSHHGFTCDIAGAWVGNSPPIPDLYTRALYASVTVSPNDTTGKRFASVVQPLNGPHRPEAFDPDSVGTYVRSGPRTYQFTWIAHQVMSDSPERSLIVGFWTFSGTAECTDANNVILSGMVSFYDMSQDSNGDGLPDTGATPYFRAPWGWTLHRLPLMAP